MSERELPFGITEDSELLRLAAQPARRLFPIFDRTRAFTPLLAGLVVLAVLVALEYRTTRESDASWGLRSLAVLSSTRFDEFIEPQSDLRSDTPCWQSPLGTWLTALTMYLAGSASPLSLVAVSACSTFAVAAMLLLLCSRLGQPRLSIWVVLMLAFHAPFLRQAQDAAPHALAILLALTTFWGFLAHLQKGGGRVSTHLLLAGLSLGLCVLAGGPLALVVLVTLLLHVLGLVGTSSRAKRRSPGRPTRVWAGWPALESLGLLALTGFAVGGWWALMMYSHHGTEFLYQWLTLGGLRPGSPPSFEAPTILGSITALMEQLIGILGVYWALSLYGLIRTCQEVVSNEDDRNRQWLLFLICWLGSTLLVFPSFVRHPAVSSDLVTLWQRFVLLPGIVFAGRAIEIVAQRRAGIPVVFLLTVCTFLTAPLFDAGPSLRSLAKPAAVAATLAIIGVGAWLMYAFCRQNETRQASVLSGMIVVQLAVGGAVGLTAIGKRDPGERELAQLRQALSRADDVGHCTLVVEDTPPAQLVYAIRSAWPHAEFTRADNWEAALRQILAEQTATRPTLLAEWSLQESRPLNLQLDGYRLRPLSDPGILRGRELRLFLLAGVSEQ